MPNPPVVVSSSRTQEFIYRIAIVATALILVLTWLKA